MSEPTFSGDQHAYDSAWSIQMLPAKNHVYLSDYITGLSPLPATEACTTELITLMSSRSTKVEDDNAKMPEPTEDIGAKKDKTPKLYLGFHLTPSDILSIDKNIDQIYYKVSERDCKDYSNDAPDISRLETYSKIANFLYEKTRHPFQYVWPPSMVTEDVIFYSRKLSNKFPRLSSLNGTVKTYEDIFNKDMLLIEEERNYTLKMMWHFDGDHYHPKWFDYEPFDAQKVLGEKLAEVVAHHRPQHDSGSS